jgi:hypothetical protein
MMNRSKLSWLLQLGLLLFMPVIVHAQVEGDPDNWCRNGSFTNDRAGFRTGKVIGAKGTRIYFYADGADDCPRAGAKCRAKAYLVPGDVVVASRKFSDYVCVWYAPGKGYETVGWLPAANVSLAETTGSPASSSWVGNWEYGIQSIRIKPGKKPGALAVEGQAYWRGLGDNVHTGDLGFEAQPVGIVLTLEENEDLCAATLKLVGDFLVVTDNLKCGGVNVTFNGVYRRTSRAGVTRKR